MKRAKFEAMATISRVKLLQILMAVVFFYIFFMSFPLVYRTSYGSVQTSFLLENRVELFDEGAPFRFSKKRFRRMGELKKVSGLAFDASALDDNGGNGELSEIQTAAKNAWIVGKKLWEEIESEKINLKTKTKDENRTEFCPHSITVTGSQFQARNRIVELPCGMTLWSHLTVVGIPRWAHQENDPKISILKEGDESVMVSQFMMELQGLKTVDGEDPPRILHFNPRLKGDWSRKPVIEQNTCYRQQWGSALRCEGWRSNADEETVDGHAKCEKWIRDDDSHSEESKVTWWLNRLIGRTKKVSIDWPYPFAEGRLFVLTLSAGLEGYHVNVDGRHITSFPYRTGFILEEATGLYVNGDVDIHYVFGASLPTSHSSFAPQKHIEMSSKWKAPPLLNKSVELFIGILSAGNHFSERMAVRKTWMQHNLIKSSSIVVRFFVALNGRKEVNLELKKEAEFFGDVVIVPYMDNYDLVVLKTVAICEYGIHTVMANYIMKCDDDTFVRVDVVMKAAQNVNGGKSVYIGNMNYRHKPLRHGKWAVTYEEWPEEDYPPYANGPGYIVSSNIAEFIASEFEKHKLRLFKMEDVSMGMWVEQFNSTNQVEYVHSLKFCQFGCVEDYLTAHYQSPRQMMCLWEKLQQRQRPQCCNMR